MSGQLTLAELQDEYDFLRRAYDDVQKERDALRKEKDEFLEQASTLRFQLANQSFQLADTSSSLDKANTENLDLKRRVERLTNEGVVLERKVKEKVEVERKLEGLQDLVERLRRKDEEALRLGIYPAGQLSSTLNSVRGDQSSPRKTGLPQKVICVDDDDDDDKPIVKPEIRPAGSEESQSQNRKRSLSTMTRDSVLVQPGATGQPSQLKRLKLEGQVAGAPQTIPSTASNVPIPPEAQREPNQAPTLPPPPALLTAEQILVSTSRTDAQNPPPPPSGNKPPTEQSGAEQSGSVARSQTRKQGSSNQASRASDSGSTTVSGSSSSSSPSKRRTNRNALERARSPGELVEPNLVPSGEAERIFTPEAYAARLATTLTVHVPPIDPSRRACVSRRFLGETYGCLQQEFVSKGQSSYPEGKTHFLASEQADGSFMPQNLDPTTNAQATHPKQWRVLFPNDDMNPCLPSNPGEPGMVFANRFEILDGESWTVFRKVEKSKPVLWVMDGEYVFTQCEAPLSGEEFGRQSDVVKKSWGSHILGARRCQSYVEIHARVYLRLKYPGEEITKERLDKAVSEIRKTNKEQPAKVQSRDVINALTCGEEVINILVMQCVGYDYAFEAEMREKMDEFVPSKGKGKGKGKSRAKPGPKSARSKPKPKAPVARRREEASDSGDDDPDAMEVEEIVRERRRSGRFVANAGSVVDRDGAEEEEESDGDGEDDDYAE